MLISWTIFFQLDNMSLTTWVDVCEQSSSNLINKKAAANLLYQLVKRGL